MELHAILLILSFPLGFTVNVTPPNDINSIMQKLKDLQSHSDALEQRIGVLEEEQAQTERNCIVFKQTHNALKQTVDTCNALMANMTESVEHVQKEFDNYKQLYTAKELSSSQMLNILQRSISDLKDDLTNMTSVVQNIANRTSQLQKIPLNATVSQRLKHQSGFTAITGRDQSASTNQVIVFHTVVSTFGNGYDRRTGVFTADVDGVYVFFVSARGDGNFDYCSLRIVKNGSPLTVAYYDGAYYETHFSDSTQVVVDLNVGDRVWVRDELDRKCVVDDSSTFMGFLINV